MFDFIICEQKYQQAGLQLREYNNLRKVEQKSNMNSISYQNAFTHYDLMFSRFSQFLCSFQQQHQFKDQVNNFVPLDPKAPYFYKPSQEVETPSFQSRVEPSIILKSAPKTTSTGTTKNKKTKQPQKTVLIQKQSRNVLSNLFRILLRNIIQAKCYNKLIQKIINKRSLSCSLQEFHEWIQSFNINFKNYIRFAQVKKLFSGSQNQEMHRIVRILIRQYSMDDGVRHCLTSRRIDPTSINMHLGGLRELINTNSQ